jgi:tRNA/rRNA methyltransferase
MKNPVMILNKPQMGENIGAAARAMLNFGLTAMRIVCPRDGWPNPRAIDMAAGAFDQIPPPQIYTSLAEALSDLHVVYATTARPRDMIKPVFTPRTAAQDMLAHQNAGINIGLVFGSERAGLNNDEIALCHNIITAALNPDFSSLNLGQAVLLLSYEYHSAANQALPELGEHTRAPTADHKTMEEFLQRLEMILDEKGFFRTPELRPTASRNIRNLLMRSQPSDQEVRTLHGIVTALSDNKKSH